MFFKSNYIRTALSLGLYLVISLAIFGCEKGPEKPYPFYDASELKSICVEQSDWTPLPCLEQQHSLTKIFVIPTKFRTFVAGFVNEFVSGLEKKGWLVVDYESQLMSKDISADIKKATGISKEPDIVAFYLPDFITRPDPWREIASAKFTKILISEDLNYARSHEIAREFAQWGDAVFARYPEAFTKVIAPMKVLSFPLYHSATHWYFDAFDKAPEKKSIALLSGATDSNYYPLRAAALNLVKTDPKLVEQRRFPGYGTNIDPDVEARDYANDIASHLLAITGAGMGNTPAPYILAKHFEIAAAGSVIITDEFVVPQLKKLGFIENKHFISATPDTLKEVISKWLLPENKEKLIEMGKAAHELAKSRHSNEHRVEEFDELATQVHFLRTKSVPATASTETDQAAPEPEKVEPPADSMRRGKKISSDKVEKSSKILPFRAR